MAKNATEEDLEQAIRAQDSLSGEEVTPGEAVEREVARHPGTWDEAVQEASDRS
jgi:hypothetical protein